MTEEVLGLVVQAAQRDADAGRDVDRDPLDERCRVLEHREHRLARFAVASLNTGGPAVCRCVRSSISLDWDIGLACLGGGYADRTFKLPNPYYFIP